jgi:selenocysteine lyase/cysteine desulfurase
MPTISATIPADGTVPADDATRADGAATGSGQPAGSTPLLPVVGADLAVPLVTGGTVRYANLDYAATAPALTSVAERVAECLTYYSSVHRGAGWPSMVSTALFEQARESVAAFVGARPADVVVFTRNTTDAFNLLASVVPAGCRVIHFDAEHHANLLPWQRCDHTVIPVAGNWWETLCNLESALVSASRNAATDSEPALVAITGACNVTGEIPPLTEVVAMARAYGARIAVDAAQLIPHRRVDMARLDIDYLAFSGHKLYAPFGIGALVGRRDWLDAGPPYLRGGGAVRDVSRSGVSWTAAPTRHEAGTPNLVGAIAMAAACDALASLPAGKLHAHERALLSRLDAGLAELPHVRTLRIWPGDDIDRVAVVGFTVPGNEPERVAVWLSAEHGIGVRHGRFCAHQLVSMLEPLDGTAGRSPGSGSPGSGPPGSGPPGSGRATSQALRASAGVGSTLQDIDRLVDALRRLAESGESWSYARQEGHWMPSPDPRSWGPAREFRGSASSCEA